jgi:hypothetical protein
VLGYGSFASCALAGKGSAASPARLILAIVVVLGFLVSSRYRRGLRNRLDPELAWNRRSLLHCAIRMRLTDIEKLSLTGLSSNKKK